MPASRPLIFVALFLLILSACSTPETTTITLYSGRAQSLVEPLLNRFEEETGIVVDVRYGDTAQLAVALMEEGDQSPADLFWAQDAGALGAVQAAGLLTPLPDSIRGQVIDGFAATDGAWIATSGRARVLAYSPERMDPSALPSSILDLTHDGYAGRVGWAPTNGSFQAAVTAMRHSIGERETRTWLEAMVASGVVSYGNNRAILEAIANDEIDLGIPNHYYLYRYKADNPAYPVEQSFFAPGDIGNLINVAGIGHLASSDNALAAQQLVSFLLAPSSQAYFANETFEYPVVPGVETNTVIADFDRIGNLKPDVALDSMRDLEATLNMLRDVGLL